MNIKEESNYKTERDNKIPIAKEGDNPPKKEVGMSKKKNATMAFALISTASILGFTSPNDVSTPDNPKKEESEPVFPAWEDAIAQNLLAVEDEQPSVFNPETALKAVDTLTSGEEQKKGAEPAYTNNPGNDENPVFLVDDESGDYENQDMRSYFKLLGELMYQSTPDDESKK